MSKLPSVNETKVRDLDSSLIKAAKQVVVLKALTWPAEAEEIFLEQWRRGDPRLPTIELRRLDLGASIEALDSIAGRCDREHPVERFLSDTAESYAEAGRMLSHVGTNEFTNCSIRLYGRPDTPYKTQEFSAVDGARFFLTVTDELLGNPQFPSLTADIPAEEFAQSLRRETDAFFHQDKVAVVVDPDMSAKALAGAKRIRVRASALFSELDKNQLLHHEAFIHTATQLNGRKQERLRSLGLATPRTTRTQEGIAVLAELITGSIDISRLRRVALRVIAVKMALDGADFIDLFRFFLDAGQSEVEAVRSAQRIFRGGAVDGKVVFTKDSVYLEGLIEVHTFLRLAIRDNQPGVIRNLFAGRLTMGDALRLDPWFQSRWLIPPTYVPDWAADPRRLAATMAYSAFMNRIKLESLNLERAIAFEDELRNAGSALSSQAL